MRSLVVAPLIASVLVGCRFEWMRPRYPTQRRIARFERALTVSAPGGWATLPGGRGYVQWPQAGGKVVTGDENSALFWLKTRVQQKTLRLRVHTSGCWGFGYRPYSKLRPVRRRVAEGARRESVVELTITEADGTSSEIYATAATVELRCNREEEQIEARFWARFNVGEVSGWVTTSARWDDYRRPE